MNLRHYRTILARLDHFGQRFYDPKLERHSPTATLVKGVRETAMETS